MPESTSGTAEEAARGRPYYEKLRNDLKATLEKKRELDKTMATIEASIARAENSYLEETSNAGNIIKGFDNYIKASSSGGGGGGGTGTATRRKGGVSDQDRIFSRSSVSWMMRDSPAPAANLSSTPSEGATPAASVRDTPTSNGPGPSHKAGTKHKKKAAVDKDKDKDDTGADSERPGKRAKISWGRD